MLTIHLSLTQRKMPLGSYYGLIRLCPDLNELEESHNVPVNGTLAMKTACRPIEPQDKPDKRLKALVTFPKIRFEMLFSTTWLDFHYACAQSTVPWHVFVLITSPSLEILHIRVISSALMQ